MRSIKGLLFPIFCLLFFQNLQAQYPVLNQEPAGQQWYQANTPDFRIIFPQGTDSLAIGLARKMQQQYSIISSTLDAYPRKLPLILRSKTTISNGFVTLAPRRSEFFTMPPQDYNFAGTNQWLDLLSIHEYRHVVQFEKSKTGFNKLLYYAFGEEALAGMSYLAVPQWLWEGDAVVMETVLTPSGRGRIPEFSMAFKTNLLQRGAFSYNKQYLRSFKHYVPDHYVTGYYMVSYLRRKYEYNPWDNILENAFSKSFIPFIFSTSIKKETGKNVVKTYRGMINEVDSLWVNQVARLDTTRAVAVSKANPKAYTNYMYPQAIGNHTVVALKSGIGDISQLVTIKEDGTEKRELITGFVANSGLLSAKNGLVVWNEYRPDLRWGARTLNQIKLYNLTTGKLKTITPPSRYSSASLSPDTTKIATVYVAENNKSYLVILDRYTGEEVYRFPDMPGKFIAMPQWSENGEFITATLSSTEGKTIVRADVEQGTLEELFPPVLENIGFPVQYGDFILYNSAYSGIDNIYAFNLKSGERFQVTSRNFGAFNPALSPDGKTLYFNDYQVDGMQVAQMPYLPDSWKPLEEVTNKAVQYYEPIIDQEKQISKIEDDKTIAVKVDKYRNLKHLFNLHSWGVLLTESGNELAVGVRAQDILSTSVLSTGYAFNTFENTGYAYGRLSYQGFFPIIDLEGRIGHRSIRETIITQEKNYADSLVSWNEGHASLGLRIPLNLTRSKYFQTLTFSSKIGLTKVSDFNFQPREQSQQANGWLSTLNYSLRYARLLKTSKRDIFSKWGQVLEGGFEHTPLGGDYSGRLGYLQGQIFLPGLFKHHSFYVRGAYQNQDLGLNYRFANQIFYPRGYGYIAFENLYLASFNYALPLFYPDWSVGPSSISRE